MTVQQLRDTLELMPADAVVFVRLEGDDSRPVDPPALQPEKKGESRKIVLV